MKALGKSAAAALVATVLTGCGGMNIDDFAGCSPELRLEDYFAGQTRAWGVFEDRFGRLRRQFAVDVDGAWDGRTLTLDERFVYSDGETDRRVWTIEPGPDGGYVGRAGDVVGEASGRAVGNALNWRYDMDLKVGDSVWRVGFDDWFFLQPDGVLINRARVSRWGFEIGTLSIFFRKKGTAAESGAQAARCAA